MQTTEIQVEEIASQTAPIEKASLNVAANLNMIDIVVDKIFEESLQKISARRVTNKP